MPELYVTPNGEEGLATIAAARDAARKMEESADSPVVVRLAAGRHRINETLKLGPEDSFVHYVSADQAVVDAGEQITGWQEEKLPTGATAWTADVSDVMDRLGAFRQLFVHSSGDSSQAAEHGSASGGKGAPNTDGLSGTGELSPGSGRRAKRSRLPKEGYYWIDDVPGMDFSLAHRPKDVQKHTFVAKEGHWQVFRNIGDVEVCVMHWWHDDRRPVKSYDPATRTVVLAEETHRPLVDDLDPRWARYYVDNVFEGLSEPGEWYLDRAEKKLYYVPMPGETKDATEVFAAGPAAFVEFAGDPDAERFVEGVRFEGIVFEHSDWRDVSRASQSNADLPGAITMVGARDCGFEDCAIRHAGNYAVDIQDGCTGCSFVGCTIEDIGAGGFMISGADARGPRARRTGEIAVTDCHIHALGRVHHAGAGVLMKNTYGNWVMHNHIHDLFYTGISCGWVWGYGESVSRDHRIEFNHLHDIGQGELNDMGAIYLLGVNPGTALRNNLIHDVRGFKYGGWGIYPDEGSSHIVIENNVVYDCRSQCFHHHYGRESSIRNNIWAFAEEGIIAISRGNDTYLPNKHAIPDGRITSAFTFERNIVVTDGSPVFLGGMEKWIGDESGSLEGNNFISDLNLFYDAGGRDVWVANGGHLIAKEGYDREFTWSEWAGLGNDTHSAMGDPKFADLDGRDFTLAADSPARALGFKPIDLSRVGPRSKGERGRPTVPEGREPNR